MKKKVLISFSLIAFIAISVAIWLFSLNWWTLTVMVTLGENKPQSNAEVLVVDSITNFPVSFGRTNEKGVVNFRLPSRNYRVNASYRSHNLQLSPFEGMITVFLNSDQTVHIAIRGGL